MKMASITVILSVAASVALATPAWAQNVSFKDQTIKMIIPTTAGGSTDLTARLFARYLGKYLPGNPTIVPSNMPAGQGVAALNFVAQQAAPDGLTITISSNSQVDPIVYRAPQSQYDPSKFEIVGAVGIGDNIMIIRTDALPRLLDKSQPPVTMGTVTGTPRSGMRMTVWGSEFLGWNVKWISGYPGSTDLVLALERGEIDMTSFPRFYVIDKLTDTKKYKVIYLDGLIENAPPSGRADADNAPLLAKAMAGKIKDPKIKAAYDYWYASGLFKWFALPPKTPEAIRDTYREAFNKIIADPEFKVLAEKTIEGFTPISPENTVKMIRDLAATSNEAIETMNELMRKQGLDIPHGAKGKKS